MKILRNLLFFSLLLGSLSFFAGCDHQQERNTMKFTNSEGLVWNTQFHLTYNGPESITDSARSLLADLGHTLSVFDTASMVSRVNRQDSTPVNSDFIRVWAMARKVNKLSNGAFDPTVSPLITAWGFGPGHKISPDTARIDSLMQFVGIQKTHVRKDALIKDNPGIQFNFSAIAKGYGCDRIGEMMKKNGISDYLIEIGGELAASGHNAEGGKWRVAIDRPLFEDSVISHTSQMVIEFSDMGMATSGNYRNFHRERNQTLGHTISPVSGRPIQTSIMSATVLAPTAMEADALATAFMALPENEATTLARKLHLPVLLIMENEIWTTPEFRKLIRK